MVAHGNFIGPQLPPGLLPNRSNEEMHGVHLPPPASASTASEECKVRPWQDIGGG